MKKGITRLVFLVGKYAIKIPNFKHSHFHFVAGCLANLTERDFCKKFSTAVFEGNMYEYVAPSIFCSWFGLMQIQIRCKPNPLDLTDEQKEFYAPLCGSDNKKQNFGILNDKLVCLDYS